jgi:TetR/AcrR family transcriptional regulator
LPPFIIQEMNNNPEFVMKFLNHESRPNPSSLIGQIEKEIESGIVKLVTAKQLLMDIFSLAVFPFAALIFNVIFILMSGLFTPIESMPN